MSDLDLEYKSRCTSLEYLREHTDEEWHLGGLSHIPGLSLNDILTLDLPNTRGYWDLFFTSQMVPIEDVRKYPHLPWNRNMLSHNRGITMKDVHRDLETYDTSLPYMPNAIGSWFFPVISMHISLRDIKTYPHHRWARDVLSLREDVGPTMLSLRLPNAVGQWDRDLIRSRT